MHLFRVGDSFALGWTADGAAFMFLFDVSTVARAKCFLSKLLNDKAISWQTANAAFDMIEASLSGD